MGMTKNKDDLAIYSLRLNLTRPEHLKLHQKLQNMKGGAYKSINAFLFEAVSGYINHSYTMKMPREEHESQSDCKEYAIQDALEKIEARLRADITKEMLAFLLTYLPEKDSNTSASIQEDVEVRRTVKKETEEDATLVALSNIWS